MNRIVSTVANRLSLRAPQRRSLEILDRLTELLSLKKGADRDAAMAALKAEYPGLADFEREFPSVCFALATGVGKTRLMGAFITYLHLAHGVRNFFVLAPNLTIYNKLIADFTPNTPKYVFRVSPSLPPNRPTIITGDNYESDSSSTCCSPCRVNIFNISKINSEVRGGKPPADQAPLRVHRGELLRLSVQTRRPRAAHGRIAPLSRSAGVRAINELRPILGLELTATPFTESCEGTRALQERHL